MALTKYRLRDLIQQRREKYDGTEQLPSWGVSKDGFIQPRQDGADTSIYNVYYKNDFVFNPARMELNSIALNQYFDKAICSSLYEIFFVTRTDIVLPEYLNIYIKRDEFARKRWFEAIGSARNYFRVANLSEFEIQLPSIPIQQKYVDIYNAMLANQQSYEHGLADLKLVCDAYIEKCKTSSDYFSLSELIEEFDERNTNLICNAAFGVNKEKQFMPTVASGDDLSKYKVVRKGQFACNLMHVGRDITIPVAFNNSTDFLVVSPAYLTFQTRSNLILPEYLLMWLSRDEIGRYAWYLCDASIRGSMEKKRFFEIAIPVPPIKEQQALVELFSALSIRKELLNKLRLQVKSLCPILIKGSIEEGMRTNEA